LADRRRLTANLAAVGLLVALVAGVLFWQRPWHSSDHVASTLPDNARTLLAQQFHDLSDATTRRGFAVAAGRSKAARSFAGSVWDARARVGATDVRFGYQRGGEAVDRADGSTSARVEVSWRPSEASIFAGSRPAAVTVRFRLVPRPDGFEIVSASASGHDRLPIWLAGPIRLERAGSATVVMVGRSRECAGVAPLARVAVGAVRRLQPEASNNLLVVCPHSARLAAAFLGRQASDISQIVAISTPLGGARGTPAIVVNPRLFGAMDKRARQVIMSHEATHLLTGVIGKHPELWVAEGYADYVALRRDRARLSVSAGQILSQVRVSGPPKTLPSGKAFDESAHGLGAVYESAWMAFRLLGERFGDAAVTGFYRDVVAGVSVDVAAQNHFGWSVAELTTAWRDYLTKSASTVS